MSTKPYSLRLRLLSLISIPVIASSILIGGISLFFIYHEIDEVYDAELSSASKVLYQLIAHEIEEHEETQFELGKGPQGISHHYEKNIVFSVWKDAHLVTQSPGTDFLVDIHPQAGFSTQIIEGKKWRLFVYVDDVQHITIQAAEKLDIRTELILQILGSMLIPATFFLPLIFVLIWLGTTWSLKPVVTLSLAVDKRDAGDLTPLEPAHVPQEITSLVRALNRLLERVSLSLRQEREFTDNAAHELRTPLAAMKTQVQVLIKQSNLSAQDIEGLENLLASINRSTYMVDQLLSFARLQSQDQAFNTFAIDGVINQVARDITPLADAKNQHLNIQAEPQVLLNGSEQAISILVRNLLENAIKFTPQDGCIDVALKQSQGMITLRVSDTGPGIADAYKTSVFERFFRLDKSKPHGSGLGLAMVRWIADMHSATVSFSDNSPHGLVATVHFNAA